MKGVVIECMCFIWKPVLRDEQRDATFRQDLNFSHIWLVCGGRGSVSDETKDELVDCGSIARLQRNRGENLRIVVLRQKSARLISWFLHTRIQEVNSRENL
jgi:hypothetical protein